VDQYLQYQQYIGASPQRVSEGLANDAAKVLGCIAGVREREVGYISEPSALEFYNESVPFYFPKESIEAEIPKKTPKEVLRMIASLAKRSTDQLWWWTENQDYSSEITYGKGTTTLYSSVVGNTESSIDFGKKVHKFFFSDEFWVEVASPKIKLAATNKGSTYESSRI
jgi:hypothetical protein